MPQHTHVAEAVRLENLRRAEIRLTPLLLKDALTGTVPT